MVPPQEEVEVVAVPAPADQPRRAILPLQPHLPDEVDPMIDPGQSSGMSTPTHTDQDDQECILSHLELIRTDLIVQELCFLLLIWSI